MADQNKVTVIIEGQNQAGPAFAQAEEQLGGLGAAMEKLGGLLKGLLLAEVAAKLVQFAAHTFEAAQNLHHLSQESGISIETLSGLAYAAGQTGVGTDQLEVGLKRLAKTISDASAGIPKAQQALQSVGVAARDSNGHMTSLSSALLTIADRFSRSADGTAKAAEAQLLFGRSGQQMIPLLNQGAEGIQRLTDEAERLGIVLTDKDAAAIQRMNEDLKRLQATGQGFMTQFLLKLVPELSKIIDAETDATGVSDRWATAGERLGNALKFIVFSFQALDTAARLTLEHLSSLGAALVALAKGEFTEAGMLMRSAMGLSQLGFGPNPDDLQAFQKLSDLWDKLFSKQALKPQLKMGGSGDELDRPDARDLGAKNAEADAKFKMEQAKLAADFQKKLNEEEQKQLDALLKHNMVAYGDYYEKKKALAASTLQVEIDMIGREIAAQDELLAKLPEDEKNHAARVKALMEINKLTEQQTVLQSQLNILLAKTGEAARDAGLRQVDAMEKAGGAAQQVWKEQIQPILSDLQLAEEQINFAASQGQLTQLQQEQKLNAVRQQAADKLRAMAAQYRALAAASGDPAMIENAKRLGQQIDELSAKTSRLKVEGINALQSGFEGLFKSLITGSKNAAQAFGDFAKSILDAIAQIIAKMIAMWIIGKLLGLFTGGFSGAVGKGGSIDVGSIGKAAGGAHAQAGQPFFVGEEGPELFMPDQAGTIVPHNRAAAMGGNTFVYNIDARGATPAERERMLAALQQTEDRAVGRSVVAVSQMNLRGYSG